VRSSAGPPTGRQRERSTATGTDHQSEDQQPGNRAAQIGSGGLLWVWGDIAFSRWRRYHGGSISE
jgi:hypothetical protein